MAFRYCDQCIHQHASIFLYIPVPTVFHAILIAVIFGPCGCPPPSSHPHPRPHPYPHPHPHPTPPPPPRWAGGHPRHPGADGGGASCC
jgi:hypothetical protein